MGLSVIAIMIVLLFGVPQPLRAQSPFSGNLTDAWFIVKGSVESRGFAWTPGEIARMKQGMTFYLNIKEVSAGLYQAKTYSSINGCWQQQGQVNDITVAGDLSEDNAFFMFFGEGTSYRDNTPGQWCPVTTNTLAWGALSLLKKDETGTGIDKMKIEFRFTVSFDDGLQFATLKGKSVAPPSPICPDTCPPASILN